MKNTYHLEHLIKSQTFRFERLAFKDVENSPVFDYHSYEISDQEICLFHRNISNGNQYFHALHDLIRQGMSLKKSTPVVRFADGEYAFYDYSLHCNGLYQQAESVESIKNATPAHIEALEILSRSGRLAALIYPGNVHLKKKGLFSFFCKPKGDNSALKFIDFLYDHNIELTNENYLPFYVVYAYLTSEAFGNLVNGKKICVISSKCNITACTQWFAKFSSYPDIVFVEIPDSYVATRWKSVKEKILNQIPSDIDFCLIGAGVGSLLVCVDVAEKFSIPTVDAGHVVNMMNGREDKSGGPRLYTIHKQKYKLI